MYDNAESRTARRLRSGSILFFNISYRGHPVAASRHQKKKKKREREREKREKRKEKREKRKEKKD